jgi:hypothetical protein
MQRLNHVLYVKCIYSYVLYAIGRLCKYHEKLHFLNFEKAFFYKLVVEYIKMVQVRRVRITRFLSRSHLTIYSRMDECEGSKP